MTKENGPGRFWRSLTGQKPQDRPEYSLDRGSGFRDCFERLSRKSVKLGSLINIGAGRGDDIGAFRTYWPEIEALMIDMDPRFEPTWKGLAKTYPVKYAICGAGAEDKEGFYSKTNDVGGALVDRMPDKVGETTRIRRVDTLVAEHNMPGPYFLKFDTHGVELDVLKGAAETLKATNLIMMEVYNFKLRFAGGKNLTFDEMSLHMKSIGFRCIDMCDPLFRPNDHVLWQFHMIFFRDDHPIWKNVGYNG